MHLCRKSVGQIVHTERARVGYDRARTGPQERDEQIFVGGSGKSPQTVDAVGDAVKLPGLRMVAKQIPRESCAPSLPGGEVSALAFSNLVQSVMVCFWYDVCDM